MILRLRVAFGAVKPLLATWCPYRDLGVEYVLAGRVWAGVCVSGRGNLLEIVSYTDHMRDYFRGGGGRRQTN